MALTSLSQNLLQRAGVHTSAPTEVVTPEPEVAPEVEQPVQVEAVTPAFQAVCNDRDINTQENLTTYALNLERYSDSGNFFTLSYNADLGFIRIAVTDVPDNAKQIGATHKVKLNSLIKTFLGVTAPFNAQQYWYSSKPVVDVFFSHDNFPLVDEVDLTLADLSTPGAVLTRGSKNTSVNLFLSSKITEQLVNPNRPYVRVYYNTALRSMKLETLVDEAPGLYNFYLNASEELAITSMQVPNNIAETFFVSDDSVTSQRVQNQTATSVVLSF